MYNRQRKIFYITTTINLEYWNDKRQIFEHTIKDDEFNKTNPSNLGDVSHSTIETNKVVFLGEKIFPSIDGEFSFDVDMLEGEMKNIFLLARRVVDSGNETFALYYDDSNNEINFVIKTDEVVNKHYKISSAEVNSIYSNRNHSSSKIFHLVITYNHYKTTPFHIYLDGQELSYDEIVNAEIYSLKMRKKIAIK